MTPEKRVQDKIVKYLKSLETQGHPIFIERRQAGGYCYKTGLPDIYIIYNGQHIEIEVKAPGGEQSTMQKKWERRFKQIKVPYICAYSLIEFKNFMKDFLIQV